MKTDIDTIPNLYSITGNILDINTVLINREELRKLVEAKKELLDALFAALGLLRDDYPRTVEHMLELYTKHLNSYKD